MPNPVRIAFRSFSDIENPETYVEPPESLVLRAGYKASVGLEFNLTEWWKFDAGRTLSKPFDVGEELVSGLLRVLEIVSASFNQSII